jgi:hypothetical protein
MTFQEAVKHVNSRSGNINLQWFVCEWNDGYIIHSSTYMRRYPDTKYEYTTGDGNINKSWYVEFDKKEKRFKHIVK